MPQDDVVVQAFTELAPSYEATVDRELRMCWGVGYREFIGRLIEGVVIEEGDAVLDVATGTALIPLELADRLGPRSWVLGLDITPDMLERGRAKIEAAEWSSRIGLVCASGMDMPFVEGAFDVAICALGTHHMDVPKMLAEMSRVLKIGGKLIMADVDRFGGWLCSGYLCSTTAWPITVLGPVRKLRPSQTCARQMNGGQFSRTLVLPRLK